jgi:hypothetical protein
MPAPAAVLFRTAAGRVQPRLPAPRASLVLSLPTTGFLRLLFPSGVPLEFVEWETPPSSPQERHGALAQDLVVKGQCGGSAHHPQADMEGH